MVAVAAGAAGDAVGQPLRPMSEAELEIMVQAQLRKGWDHEKIFGMLRQAAASGRPIGGAKVVELGTLERLQGRLEGAARQPQHAEAGEPPAKSRKLTSSTVTEDAAAPPPSGATPQKAAPTAATGKLDAVALPPPGATAGAAGNAGAGGAAEVAAGKDDAAIMAELLREREERRRKEEAQDREVRIMKEQRLRDIFEDMDTQMRSWCQKLLTRKCVGEPWRNVGKNKLKVLREPSVGSETFEGEYIPASVTFGVEEVRGGEAGAPKWLRLPDGGWVCDHSRKPGREHVVVAERAGQHTEIASDDVFRIRQGEDRRQAYMRMVHRRSEVDLQMPEGLRVELLPYQVEGVEWLISLFNNDLAGLLADEMGLGKTIQTIALLAFLKETKKRYGPHLIICPKSVVTNWQKELGKCFPEYEEYIVVFAGNPAEREELAKKIRKSLKKSRKKLIVVTNYEQVHPDKNQVLHEPRWETIVIDEGHRMKNQKSVFHQTMKEHFKARMKLLLTGTPLQNNLDELFALLNYLLPEIFTSATSFKSWFAAPFLGKLETMHLCEYHVDFTEEEEQLLISNLHAMLAPFLLQRTKADVLSLQKLPARREETIRVPLSAWQERTYQDLKAKTLRWLDGESGEISHSVLRNTTMQLRKVALHPYLFGRGVGGQNPEDLVRASGKMEALDRILRKLHHFGHKVLVFSQFTSMLDLLEEYLALRGWGFERIDGQVSAEDRQARINRFSEPDSKSFVFLLSARAGAVGLNLQAADTVIFFDLDWNPQNDKQAVGRAHRIGQTKQVLVIRLLTLSPVEEHMERCAREKLQLEEKIIGAGGFSKKGHGKTPEERAEQLRELFGAAPASTGAEAKESSVAAAAGGVPAHVATALREANAFLARTEEERARFESEDVALGLAAPPGSGGAGQDEDFPVPGPDARPNVLVRSGRLMAPEEVPEGFQLAEEDTDSE